MSKQTIFRVHEEWRDQYAAGYRVEHDGGQHHDVYVEHGDLDDDSVEWGTMEGKTDLIESFKDAWARFFAEKAKRSVVVSTETMRAASELPDHYSKAVHAILRMRDELRVERSLFSANGETVFLYGAPQTITGWWPLPDSTPMPDEFAGWEI